MTNPLWALSIAVQVLVLVLLVVYFRMERRDHKRRMQGLEDLQKKLGHLQELFDDLADTLGL